MISPQQGGEEPSALEIPRLEAAYRQALRRLLFLDYDGTLVPFHNRPENAIPAPRVVETVRRIAGAPRTAVMIVSGRTAPDLESFFGAIPDLWMAAEHGALLRRPGNPRWHPIHPEWRAESLAGARRTMERAGGRLQGSFIETKQCAVAWHYRMAEPGAGTRLARELLATLETELAGTELRAIRGHKIVEVRPVWVHKGAVVPLFREACGPVDFECAVGDDRTDEDLFASLGPRAWTVHVGSGASLARFSLPDPERVVDLLGGLETDTTAPPHAF